MKSLTTNVHAVSQALPELLQSVQTVAPRLQGDLCRLRAMIVALKLAAYAGEGGKDLYWPDLMEAVELLIPDDDLLQPMLDAARSIATDAAQGERSNEALR